MTRPYVRPTELQKRIITTLLETGSLVAAARKLGMTDVAVRVQMHAARRRGGFASTEQMIYAGTRDGWLSMHETLVGNAPAGL